jgi:putative transposase
MSANNKKNRTQKFNKFHEILSSIIPADLIDSISTHVKDQHDLQDLVTILKKRVVESALNGEMNHHLNTAPDDSEHNYRNGYSNKMLNTETGVININIPRDRNAEFEPIFMVGDFF